MRASKEPSKDGITKVINNDLWPFRDHICYRTAYKFMAADLAIERCKKRDLVIQAGGNVGAWPRYLRTIFSEVYTFEPSLENYGLMVRNLGDLDIRKFHAALSDKIGRCGIRQNPKNCGDDQTVDGDEVDTLTIDSLGVNPDLIYLDIQGDEYRVLLGAQETINRCNPIIGIEVDERLARMKGDPIPLLKDLGYVQFANRRQDFLFERLI